MKIGLYVCECGINIAKTVDVAKVTEYANSLPHVVSARYYKYMCSEPGQALIKQDIKELELDRVVVASCSPRMHEPTFRNTIQEAGLNQYCFEMANIREQCSWVHDDKDKATKKALTLVKGAIARAACIEPLSGKKVDVTSKALVLGGGIAGIQAALKIADHGFKTYLVEREPSIGGRMAQLDKTFPTLDCSACILTPKMVDVLRNKNIELLTYSEAVEVEGYVGNFKVKVRKKPRYIDLEKCTGCGECTKKCPIELPNEFDLGLGIRKAIYVPFPQAVPLKYTIDKRGLQPCRDACPAHVGAPGYVTLVARGKFYEALQVIKERLPFPSICGRVCHRPCEKACTRKDSDEPVGIAHIKRFVGDLELKIPAAENPPVKTKAESVAIVGGGPAGLTAAHDLAMKGYHVTIYESAPVLGGMMKFGIPTFRLPKEILRREISDILALGVRVYLNTTIGKDLAIKALFERGYKAIFLAVGAQKGRKLNIPGEELGGVFQAIDFLKEVNLGEIITRPVPEINEMSCTGCGICISSCPYGYIYEKRIDESLAKKSPKKKHPLFLKELCVGCGKCAQVCPSKAITLTGYRDGMPKIGNKVIVVGGGNAALDTARSALRLGAKEVTILYRRSRAEMPAEPEWEIDETEREGVKLVYLTTPTKIIGEKGHIKAIECVKMELGAPDETGRRTVKPILGSEFIMGVDSLILAIGQEAEASLLAKDVSLECTSWGTVKVDPVSLATNIEGVFCGGDAVLGAGTVIEAIAAGKETAISIERYINGEDLKEGRGIKPKLAEVSLEGVKKKRKVPMRYMPTDERKNNFREVELGYTLEEAIEEARRCLSCGGCSECFECVRTCEAKAINHEMKEEILELDVGAIVVATGYDIYDPTVSKPEYGYRKYPEVITGIEFERLCSASGPTGGKIIINGKEPKKVVFIQCVGSRDKNGNEYCSRVCCMYTAKQAHLIREKIPDADVTIFYTDMRAFGEGFEEFYNRVKMEGVNYKRRELDDKIEVIQEDGKLVVKAEPHGAVMADLVVLATAIVPRADTPEVLRIFNISQSADNFLLEAHPKLRPLDTFTDGIFLAGCCQSPKDIPDTVAQAAGASSRACTLLSKKVIETEGAVAIVDDEKCTACLTCVRVCPYNIPIINSEGIAEIEAAECHGCGTCASECPAKAIQIQHYKDEQIIAITEAIAGGA